MRHHRLSCAHRKFNCGFSIKCFSRRQIARYEWSLQGACLVAFAADEAALGGGAGGTNDVCRVPCSVPASFSLPLARCLLQVATDLCGLHRGPKIHPTLTCWLNKPTSNNSPACHCYPCSFAQRRVRCQSLSNYSLRGWWPCTIHARCRRHPFASPNHPFRGCSASVDGTTGKEAREIGRLWTPSSSRQKQWVCSESDLTTA